MFQKCKWLWLKIVCVYVEWAKKRNQLETGVLVYIDANVYVNKTITGSLST